MKFSGLLVSKAILTAELVGITESIFRRISFIFERVDSFGASANIERFALVNDPQLSRQNI